MYVYNYDVGLEAATRLRKRNRSSVYVHLLRKCIGVNL
jgi:hypothetical protein